MPDFSPLLIYYAEFEELRRIQEYDDLVHRFNNIASVIETETVITEGASKQLQEIIKIYWKRVIKEKCDKLIDRINKRWTRGPQLPLAVSSEPCSFPSFAILSSIAFINSFAMSNDN